MPKTRIMGAGIPGSLSYNTSVNGNQGGGNAKQGLAPTLNKSVEFVVPAIQTRAVAPVRNRNLVFCINQLGGVGMGNKNSQFASNADSANTLACRQARAKSLLAFPGNIQKFPVGPIGDFDFQILYDRDSGKILLTAVASSAPELTILNEIIITGIERGNLHVIDDDHWEIKTPINNKKEAILKLKSKTTFEKVPTEPIAIVAPGHRRGPLGVSRIAATALGSQNSNVWKDANQQTYPVNITYYN